MTFPELFSDSQIQDSSEVQRACVLLRPPFRGIHETEHAPRSEPELPQAAELAQAGAPLVVALAQPRSTFCISLPHSGGRISRFTSPHLTEPTAVNQRVSNCVLRSPKGSGFLYQDHLEQGCQTSQIITGHPVRSDFQINISTFLDKCVSCDILVQLCSVKYLHILENHSLFV